MVSTRRLLGLALAGLAFVALLAQGNGVPAITPAQAALWEGQGVSVAGVVQTLRTNPEGSVRFDLVAAGVALPTRLDEPVAQEGDAVRITGRLTRLNGVLTLLGEAVASQGPPAGEWPLRDLLQHPDTWHQRPVITRGTIADGWLRADQHGVLLGQGDWPRHGPVEATVLLRYDAACACYRLDQVRPWIG